MQFNKDLIAASSTPIVLAILAEEDSYGYAIIKRVQELSGGEMEWTDGMLYPVLHRLERLGYIKARWEETESGRRRKYYRITTRGRAQLEEERKQWQTVDATLRGLWRSTSREKSQMTSTKFETNANDLIRKIQYFLRFESFAFDMFGISLA